MLELVGGEDKRSWLTVLGRKEKAWGWKEGVKTWVWKWAARGTSSQLRRNMGVAVGNGRNLGG